MTEWKKIALYALAGVVLTSCGPKKEEQSPQKEETVQPEEKKMMPLQKPEEEHKMMPLQKPHEEKTLTPEEKDELKINEDNVMNPFPG